MGYDLNLCLDKDVVDSDPSLLCPVCALILLEPERSECGHCYCKSCLKKLRRCRICDSMLKKYSSVPAKIREAVPVLLQSKLGNLTVRCAQHCDAVIKLKEYALHCLKSCSQSLVSCTNRPVSCDQLIPRYLLRDHIDNDCVYRPVRCNVCGFKTVYANMYLHERSKRCAQLATRRREIEQHNAVSDKIKRLNDNLTSWSKWSQYNYIKQTDVKRDFIATLYSNPKLQNEVDTTSPQYQRMVRYEQSHSSLVCEHEDRDNADSDSPAPNTVVPSITYRAKMLPRRSQSEMSKPARFFVCRRCDKVHADNMPRSHKECRWHVGPLLLNTFGSTCSACRRPSYQAGCQFGRHLLEELPSRENSAVHSISQVAHAGTLAGVDSDPDRVRNPSVTPMVDDSSSVFITQSHSHSHSH